MKTSDIRNGDNLFFHKNSITRKNDNGKTCGVMRCVHQFHEIPLREQINVSSIVQKKLGINRMEFMKKINKKTLYQTSRKAIYYFNDTRYNNPILFHDETFEVINY